MKAIKRMKEIQKIQRLFHQNNSDPRQDSNLESPDSKSDALSIGPQGLSWDRLVSKQRGNSPAGVQEA